MIFEIVCFVSLIVCFILGILSVFYDLDNLMGNSFAWFLVLGFVFLIGFSASKYENEDKTTEIVSLERTSGVEGSFVLGGGYTESFPIYYAYTRVGEGYKIIKIENVILYERDETPRFEIKTICEREKGFFQWNGICTTTRSLIIPPNTIIKEFKG